jgi:hypothetical protein
MSFVEIRGPGQYSLENQEGWTLKIVPCGSTVSPQ